MNPRRDEEAAGPPLAVEGVPDWQVAYHSRVDPHGRGASMADVILGAQDGLVNVLGVLLGVAAASGSTRVALAAASAAAVAESLSMGAVAYTSSVAEGDVFRAEQQREYRHLKQVPTLEREEVRELYRRKGFHGELLERIVSTITADPDVWVAVMMSEEHRMVPGSRRRSLRSALVVLVASLAGSAVPVLPFLVVPTALAAWSEAAVSAVFLFAMGAFKARATIGGPLRSGLELALIGMASALAGWGIGELFQHPAS